MSINVEARAGSIRSLASVAGALLGTLGGLASIVYVAGFLNTWAYFNMLHAAWLVRELPQSAFPVGGLLGLLPAVFLALALEWEAPMSESMLQRVSAFLCAGAAALLLPDAAGDVLFTIQARSYFDYGSGFCFLVAAGVTARLVVEQSANNSRVGGIRAASAAVMLSALLFVFAPIVLGRGEGLSIYAAPSKRLQVATIRAGKTIQTKLVLLVGADRVYCVNLGASDASPVSIVPVKWDDVVSITAPRDR